MMIFFFFWQHCKKNQRLTQNIHKVRKPQPERERERVIELVQQSVAGGGGGDDVDREVN